MNGLTGTSEGENWEEEQMREYSKRIKGKQKEENCIMKTIMQISQNASNTHIHTHKHTFCFNILGTNSIY